MGTTPRYGITYPEPSDLLTAGASAMRLLAESVEAAFPAAGVIIPGAASPTELTGTRQVIKFAPSPAMMGQFTAGGSTTVLTYTGTRSRPFLVTAVVTTDWTTGLENPALRRLFADIELRQNTTGVAASPFELNLGETALVRVGINTHTLTAVMTLAPGDTVSLTGVAAGTPVIASARLTIAPTGPAVA